MLAARSPPAIIRNRTVFVLSKVNRAEDPLTNAEIIRADSIENPAKEAILSKNPIAIIPLIINEIVRNGIPAEKDAEAVRAAAANITAVTILTKTGLDVLTSDSSGLTPNIKRQIVFIPGSENEDSFIRKLRARFSNLAVLIAPKV